jgi:signal transduction histidine kinase
LLSNAIKFTSHEGKINVSAYSGINHEVVISVSDTGIGIPSDMLKNLFRIEVSSKRYGTDGEASNGLGLMLCKEFVEKHKGKIWVESEEDKGSVFSFSIPDSIRLN